MILYTIGYGRWPAPRRMKSMIEALQAAGVRLLVDTRHSPCSSNVEPGSNYGPREWNLQAGDAGIAHLLEAAGIEYRWLGELGNPQKNDHTMTILREHLVSHDDRWPVNRGLKLLREILNSRPCALLCACVDWRQCHRTVIAEAMRERYPELAIEIVHLPR
jgi:uncharacterized protein (DUF488 family)